jgi:dihydropteroate synthase
MISTSRTAQQPAQLVLGSRIVPLPARPLIMGIINITPDSFSDGGQCYTPQQAADHFFRLVDEGAELIDLGAESSRPGAAPVDVGEEWRRLGPVLSRVAGKTAVPISVDTYKAEIARRAVDNGVTLINDISALRFDPEMADTIADSGASVILMHMQGTPRNMQRNPVYTEVVREIGEFLRERATIAVSAGIPPDKVIIDPGIGFGKTLAHNLDILNRLEELGGWGYPVLIGASRKSFIGRICRVEERERVEGSLAVAVLAARAGIRIVRVHDVRQTRRALEVCAAINDPAGWLNRA